MESTLAYYHEVASQINVISSLLAGFSVAIVANLMTSQSEKKIDNVILVIATLACCCFLITALAMTKIMMITTEGYSMEVTPRNFKLPNMIGFRTFFIGAIALCVVVSLSGWTKSKTIGILTTIIGIITLILFSLAMTETIYPAQ